MEKSHFLELLAIEFYKFCIVIGQSVALTLVHTAYPFAFSFNLYGTLQYFNLYSTFFFYIASYCSGDTAAA
jgi:hypothetical protein